MARSPPIAGITSATVAHPAASPSRIKPSMKSRRRGQDGLVSILARSAIEDGPLSLVVEGAEAEVLADVPLNGGEYILRIGPPLVVFRLVDPANYTV